jgi:hypothetical protein
MGRVIKRALLVLVVVVLFLLLIIPRVEAQYGDPPSTPEPADLDLMTEAAENILQNSAGTILPMIIGLAVGMGVVVAILRFLRWL